MLKYRPPRVSAAVKALYIRNNDHRPGSCRPGTLCVVAALEAHRFVPWLFAPRCWWSATSAAEARGEPAASWRGQQAAAAAHRWLLPHAAAGALAPGGAHAGVSVRYRPDRRTLVAIKQEYCFGMLPNVQGQGDSGQSRGSTVC